AAPNFVKQYPKAVPGLIKQFNQADKWVQSHQAETASAIGQSTGLKPATSDLFIKRRPRPSSAAPLNSKVIAEQQQLADIFTQQGIIPKPISIKQAVWGAK
ncbi:sulfonate ABC transporter substrate-binding protein, partial [Acinetobacter baumannii]